MTRIPAALAGLLVAALASFGVAAEEEWSVRPKAVVELFTSQGCSSCVAADAFLAELAKRSDVVAISLHVDYWDYLGWRDTMAEPAHSERQRDYASVSGSQRVYTPQMIVNGTSEFVGSDRAAVEAAIENANLSVPVTMRHGDGTVEIEVGEVPIPGMMRTTIRLVLLTSEAEVTIARGENAGSTIEYYNVARAIRPIGMWDGSTVKITLPEDELMADGVDACAVLVQEELSGGPGAILGAAWLSTW
jgi:hypothetical protein